MFTPEEPCPLEVSLLDELVLVDVDELVVGEEIVMFKNGLRKCQKIASDPLGWKIVKNSQFKCAVTPLNFFSSI